MFLGQIKDLGYFFQGICRTNIPWFGLLKAGVSEAFEMPVRK